MFLHLSVSHSVQGGLHPEEGLHLGEGGCADPPPSGTIGYSQQAGGTHPTGMHSCVHNFHFEKTTSSLNKKAFQDDAYRPLADRMCGGHH